MSHPPIPPNTEFFCDSRNGNPCWFFAGFSSKPNGICLNDGNSFSPDKYQRQIIAAVARCAWLDEAKRISTPKSRYWDSYYGEWRDEGMSKEDAELYKLAIANAEAWRIWGEQS